MLAELLTVPRKIIVYFVKYFENYLLGREFILRIDHGLLVWLHKFREPDGQQVGPYIFCIFKIDQKKTTNADALSRISDNEMCKQDKRDTIVNWTEVKFTHIDELRNMYENRDDYRHNREVLNKGYLRNTRNYPNMDPFRKKRKQPIETLTIEKHKKMSTRR